jgi:transposase
LLSGGKVNLKAQCEDPRQIAVKLKIQNLPLTLGRNRNRHDLVDQRPDRLARLTLLIGCAQRLDHPADGKRLLSALIVRVASVSEITRVTPEALMDSDIPNHISSHSLAQGYGGRMDIVTGATGRRRWRDPVKAAIVLETFRDGVTVGEVARRHGISPAQLHAWRRAARDGLLPMPEDEVPGLLPIEISEVGRAASGDRAEPGLELEIGGVRITVPVGFNAAHFGRVVAALREMSL